MHCINVSGGGVDGESGHVELKKKVFSHFSIAKS